MAPGADVSLAGESLARIAGTVGDYWAAGGWLLVPIAVVSFLIWNRYFAIRRSLRAAARTPAGWVEALEESIAREPSQGALRRRATEGTGASSRIARLVLAENPDEHSFHDVYARAREIELEPYEASLRVLAALVVAAPLLGLLGTVFGMVETFDAVSTRTSETTDMVARGISRALITTQAGLVAALPGTFGLAHLSRLLRRVRGKVDAFEFRLDRMLARAARTSVGAGEAGP